MNPTTISLFLIFNFYITDITGSLPSSKSLTPSCCSQEDEKANLNSASNDIDLLGNTWSVFLDEYEALKAYNKKQDQAISSCVQPYETQNALDKPAAHTKLRDCLITLTVREFELERAAYKPLDEKANSLISNDKVANECGFYGRIMHCMRGKSAFLSSIAGAMNKYVRSANTSAAYRTDRAVPYKWRRFQLMVTRFRTIQSRLLVKPDFRHQFVNRLDQARARWNNTIDFSPLWKWANFSTIFTGDHLQTTRYDAQRHVWDEFQSIRNLLHNIERLFVDPWSMMIDPDDDDNCH